MVTEILRKNFMQFLQKSHLKLEITGFDMDAFEQAMRRDLSAHLLNIQSIICEDEELLPDAQKIEAVKRYFSENV